MKSLLSIVLLAGLAFAQTTSAPKADQPKDEAKSSCCASGASTSRVQRAATAASPPNSSRSIVPRTARSWLPARHTSARSAIVAQHSFGRGP